MVNLTNLLYIAKNWSQSVNISSETILKLSESCAVIEEEALHEVL